MYFNYDRGELARAWRQWEARARAREWAKPDPEDPYTPEADRKLAELLKQAETLFKDSNVERVEFDGKKVKSSSQRIPQTLKSRLHL